MVREIIAASDADTRFDRAHFKSYGESALNFEVIYYVLDPDYNKCMDILQEINFSLLQKFRERGISFAYPTRALHLAPPADLRLAAIADALPARSAGESATR